MRLKETLEIIEKLMKNCDVSDFTVSMARTWIHEEEAELIQNGCTEGVQVEYDITLTEVVTHYQIQTIDEILASYDNVEMRVESGGLRIFEKEV